MIACPQPLNAWHITSGRLGQALCGLAGDNLRITTPDLIGPHFWYQEDVHVAEAKPRTKAASRRTKNPRVGGSNPSSAKNGQAAHPGTTSTTTPAGIATIDGAAEGFTDDGERPPTRVQKVPLHLIAASPFQPRINPAEARIAELAESMQSWGFKGAIELRPIERGEPMFARGKEQARYELIDGERRLRAASQAGLNEIPAIVREMDDATAEEHVLLANEGREDLSPLERGRVIQRLLQMGHSQTAVGKMLGLTQGAVSNKTRILELPSEWLDGSIHPEISASEAHLREVCVYRASRPLLDKLAATIRKEAKRKEWDLPSVGEWREDLRYQTRAITEPMEGTQWDSKSYRSIPIFTPTEAQRAKLQIVEVPNHQGKPEERAVNVKLWKQLQGEHAAELRKQTAKKQDAKQKKAAAQQKTLSPAEQKRREKEQAERFAKRLRAWRIDWLQWVCYAELRDSRLATPDAAMLLTPFFATSQAGGDNNWNGWSWSHRQHQLKAAIAKQCPSWKPPKNTGSRSSPWGWLRQCYELGGLGAVENAIDQWQCWSLWIEEDDAKQLQCDPGAQNALPPEVIEGLADLLAVDLAAQWMAEMAGPLTYRFFSLHTKEQLLALGQELKVPLPASAGKADLVQALIDAKPARMPQEILKAKGA